MARRMMACLLRARQKGTLSAEFRAADACSACPRWAASWGTFLPKHCRGNPGDDTVHFVRVAPGLYRLVDDVRTSH